MSEPSVLRKSVAKAQSTASGHTQMTSRQPYISETPASKRVCFYKSGDAQFSGLPVVINSRTFKTFEALLDSLSKRVPLPFGVRTITTPRGHTSVQSLDQLHHGQSYICSDRRTVKPIDLERARRKLPPWYHARPASARYFAWYMHNPAKHEVRIAQRSEHGILLHSPKWLVLFRNGEAEVKYRLKLQRRTTYSFEVLLGHISEVMHTPVLKLYTPEGRRVDSLPALISCSGVLVAAGREAFKRRHYEVQRPSPTKWLQSKRLGRCRLITRKKKFNSIRSCPFSPSSENYIVNQIQSSMPGSKSDFPSNRNGSVEMELQHQSVAETEMVHSLEGEREENTTIPSDDDIEKSFRVNQDGSMTVEMKVRLTIKEEETIQWTTTVSRSNVLNQCKEALGSCSDIDTILPTDLPSQYDHEAIEVSERDINRSYPEDLCKMNEKTGINLSEASFKLEQHVSTFEQFYKQGSTENEEALQDEHAYIKKEEFRNGDVKQEVYRTQHAVLPVPKPRCTMVPEKNTAAWLQSINHRSSETFQIHENKTNVHENVVHIYKSQTDTVQLGSQENLTHDYSEYPAPLRKTPTKRDKGSAKPTSPSSTSSEAKEDDNHTASTKRKPVRVIMKKNYLLKSANPQKKQRDYKADILKEIKKIRTDILNQKGVVIPRKHLRSKGFQKLLKRRNNRNSKSAILEPQTDQLECLQQTKHDPSSELVVNKPKDMEIRADRYPKPKKNLPSKGSMKQKTEYVELWLQKLDPQPVTSLESSLEAIPKNNTRAKASLFSHKSAKTAKQSIKVSLHANKSSEREKTNNYPTQNQQSLNPTKSNANDLDNINTSEHIKPSAELDVQEQKCYSVKMAVRPDMKPVVDELCLNIKWFCKILKDKQDFCAHLTNIFGYSSRILFVFLSVMTLKDGLSNLSACYKSDCNITNSESILMLQSLKELALVEDRENLIRSLSDLHNSMSIQLLQGWSGFQTLSNKALSTTTSSVEEEDLIQELMINVGVPDRIREELSALNSVIGSMTGNQIGNADISSLITKVKTQQKSHSVAKGSSGFGLEDYVNTYVNSVIDKAVDVHLRDNSSDNAQDFKAKLEEDNQIIDLHPSNVRNENFSNMRTSQGDPLPDSDICEDLPSSEFSFGVEILKRRKDQELVNVRVKGEEDAMTVKHQERVVHITGKKEGAIEEENEEMEEENSESFIERGVPSEKEMNKAKKHTETVKHEHEWVNSDSLACREKLSASISEGEELLSSNEENFPQERLTDNETKLTGLHSKVQMSPKEKTPGQCQKPDQTEDVLQSKRQTPQKDTSTPEVQLPGHRVNVELNGKVGDKLQSMTHKDFSMESGTYSEEEHLILEAPECYTIYQEKFLEISEETIKNEENKSNIENDKESVDKLASNQQDQKKSNTLKNKQQTFGEKLLEHLNVTNLDVSHVSKMRESTSMGSLSSSLVFSYDSKNSAPGRDSEEPTQSNRVKAIRDMFLAKSNTDIRHSRLSSPNLSDYQTDSSNRKESPRSPEILREEKGPCRLSVAKGYVRRTIEQLYGKTPKSSSSSEKRSTSAENIKKRQELRETSATSRSPLPDDHTSSTPDLSYFNPTSRVEGFNEPTHCVTLNASAGPKDAVLIDKGRWLLKENQVSPKYNPKTDDTLKDSKVKDVPAKSVEDCGKEDAPYSLFGHSPVKNIVASDPGEIKDCQAKTLPYFHLPNESEIQADEQNTGISTIRSQFEANPPTESQRSSSTVLTPLHGKKAANKVHPMIEPSNPVVTQPTRKQGTEVARHSTEPDAIEILYLFCGQHCPIL